MSFKDFLIKKTPRLVLRCLIILGWYNPDEIPDIQPSIDHPETENNEALAKRGSTNGSLNHIFANPGTARKRYDSITSPDDGRELRTKRDKNRNKPDESFQYASLLNCFSVICNMGRPDDIDAEKPKPVKRATGTTCLAPRRASM